LIRWSDASQLPDDIVMIKITNVLPTLDAIYSSSYPFVKEAHIYGKKHNFSTVNGLSDYLFFINVSIPTRVWTRPDATQLAINDPRVKAYRKAIAEMMTRPASDPTSWLFQANTHGTFDPRRTVDQRSQWGSCRHDQYFLAWHRMYLYYFERIVRRASGDPHFALPYWGYSNSSDNTARYIPLMFRTPATNDNTLYRSGRRASFNDGSSSLSAADVSLSRAFEPNDYWSFQRALDGQPHGAVHIAIGGRGSRGCTSAEDCCNTGLMACFETAARDPIFWSHHSQIDRIWQLWLNSDDKRSSPTDRISARDRDWLDREFIFFDEYGNKVPMSGAEIVETAAQLNYRYENEQPPPGLSLRAEAGEEPLVFSVDPNVEHDPEGDFAILDAPSITLSADQTTVNLEATPERAEFGAEDTDIAFILSLDDISADLPTGDYYRVYLNPPEDEALDIESPYYVGVVALFFRGGKDHGQDGHFENTVQFDITGLVREGVVDPSDPDTLSLIFVRRSFGDDEEEIRELIIGQVQIIVRPIE